MISSAGEGVMEIFGFGVGIEVDVGVVIASGMIVALEGRLWVSVLVQALKRTQVPRLRQFGSGKVGVC